MKTIKDLAPWAGVLILACVFVLINVQLTKSNEERSMLKTKEKQHERIVFVRDSLQMEKLKKEAK